MSTPAGAFDLTNLLCGLAWLGELNREQIQRLWFHDRSVSTVEKTLGKLRKEKLIAARAWSVRDTERNVTVPRLARWSLTPAGHQQMRSCSDYPDRPMRPRQIRLLEHDARTAETIVRLIEIARPYGLSGIYVRHEVQLDQRRPRPTCDALVVIHLGNGEAPNRVPWSRDQHIDEIHSFGYAIESDNASETPEMLRWKGSTYARLDVDGDWLYRWRERYGEPPLPVWVAPSAARAQQIHACWCAVWPQGAWLITDDAGLRDNRWLLRRAYEERSMPIGFRVRALPPQPAPLPAPTPPTQGAPISGVAPSADALERSVPSHSADPAAAPAKTEAGSTWPKVAAQGATDAPRHSATVDRSAAVLAAPISAPPWHNLVRAPLEEDDRPIPTESVGSRPPIAQTVSTALAGPGTAPPSIARSARADPAIPPLAGRTSALATVPRARLRKAAVLVWFGLRLPLRLVGRMYAGLVCVLDFVGDIWGYGHCRQPARSRSGKWRLDDVQATAERVGGRSGSGLEADDRDSISGKHAILCPSADRNTRTRSAPYAQLW
jgi:hypothetical protein